MCDHGDLHPTLSHVQQASHYSTTIKSEVPFDKPYRSLHAGVGIWAVPGAKVLLVLCHCRQCSCSQPWHRSRDACLQTQARRGAMRAGCGRQRRGARTCRFRMESRRVLYSDSNRLGFGCQSLSTALVWVGHLFLSFLFPFLASYISQHPPRARSCQLRPIASRQCAHGVHMEPLVKKTKRQRVCRCVCV